MPIVFAAVFVALLAGQIAFTHWASPILMSLTWAVLFAGVILYLRDRHPASAVPAVRLVALAAGGAGLGILAALAGGLPVFTTLWVAMVIGPLKEEMGKILGVILVLGISRKWRTHPYVWFLGGAAAGAGFGLAENVLYYFNMEGRLPPVEAFLFRVVGLLHVITTATFGYHLAPRKGESIPRTFRVVRGLLLAFVLHAAWNGLTWQGNTAFLYLYGLFVLIGFCWLVPRMTRALD